MSALLEYRLPCVSYLWVENQTPFPLDCSDLASPQVPGTPEREKTDDTKASEDNTEKTGAVKISLYVLWYVLLWCMGHVVKLGAFGNSTLEPLSCIWYISPICQCAVSENIHSPSTEGIGISEEGG